MIAAVKFARDRDFLLAVRGGGHSAPGFGTCDGGVVLDLRRMKGILVDPERSDGPSGGRLHLGRSGSRQLGVRVGHARWNRVDHGHRRPDTRRGIGYLNRRCGLSCDNLLSADVVTADGTFVTCSADREKDLFWGIRGGGGNFGVVTSFEFRLHEVADIFGGPTFFPIDGDVLRAYPCPATTQDRVHINYGDNYDRLVEIKTKYDPTNLFHMNHNIEPIG